MQEFMNSECYNDDIIKDVRSRLDDIQSHLTNDTILSISVVNHQAIAAFKLNDYDADNLDVVVITKPNTLDLAVADNIPIPKQLDLRGNVYIYDIRLLLSQYYASTINMFTASVSLYTVLSANDNAQLYNAMQAVQNYWISNDTVFQRTIAKTCKYSALNCDLHNSADYSQCKTSYAKTQELLVSGHADMKSVIDSLTTLPNLDVNNNLHLSDVKTRKRNKEINLYPSECKSLIQELIKSYK